MSFKNVTHVIFDLDGLIIDTETIYDQIFIEFATKFGKKYTKELKMKLMATPEPITAQIAVTDMQLPYTVDEFLEVYLAREKELVQHRPLMPGARKLIEHLHKHKIPIAVATSSSEDMLPLKIQDHEDLMALFHHTVCGTTDPEVKNGKPAPDIFLVCASRFPGKPQPDQCLVFEDSPNGARGAIDAGMQVVLVPAPEVPTKSRKPATLVLDSLEEFKPEIFGLPEYE